MKSIRSRILAWVFLLFLVIWAIISYATYYQSRHEVEEVFDSELAQAAGVLIQISTTHELTQAPGGPKLLRDVYGHRYEKKIAFQIFEEGKLVLYSANAPTSMMAAQEGFSDQTINNESWRVFHLYNPDHQQRVLTAERYDVRDEIVFEITRNSLYPLSLMIPILLFIIWIGIGRGLNPIHRLTRQIEQRSPGNFEPIETDYTIPSEVHTLYKALNQLFERLRSTFERERRFTSDAAHELQTPLASIKTQAQVALRATSPDEQLHALQKISAGVDRATHLVQQLLALARLEPQNRSVEKQRLDLNRLVQNVMGELDAEAHKKQIEMDFESADAAYIQGNNTGIEILIRNLLSNAVRYTPQNGEIRVHTRVTGGSVELCISDSGPGIPEHERERVFERFYRGQDNQHIVGSGLGLSIVQRVLQMHEASIRFADNDNGPGLKVCVQFTPGAG